jgi:cysteine desulfurase / selenocysteine lyase
MPELPGSQVMSVAPGASGAGLPSAGDLERAAAFQRQAPDPAWIASIANSLFRGLPVDPITGAGASLPSGPVFAGDTVASQVQDAPNAPPPVSPNLTPGASGVPGPGASAAAAQLQAYQPLTRAGDPNPAAAVPPSGEKGETAPYSAPPFAGITDMPAAAAQSGFLSEANLASLPSTVGGAMAIIPSFDGGIPYGGPGASLPSTQVNAAEPVLSPPATAPSPGPTPSAPVYAFEPLKFVGSPAVAGLVQPAGEKSGGAWQRSDAAPYGLDGVAGPGLGAANPRETYYFLDEGLSASTQASPLPSGQYGQSLDLTKLPSQHSPELALPPISGPRQFDAHIFRRDFPILHQ